MSIEPSYPQDAAVADGGGKAPPPSPAGTGGETLGIVVSAKESTKSSETQRGGRSTRNFVAGAAVGVGSAALVAALLYASRSRRGEARTEKDPGVARLLADPED